MPHRAIGETLGFGLEADSRSRESLGSLFGDFFPPLGKARPGKAGQGKQLKTG